MMRSLPMKTLRSVATISDGQLTDDATVAVTVNPVNDAPVAVTIL
ncbi:cadherin-like domain-containing protein [Vibrio harveyi]|nr:cadherin-like domain-containing protein [Vibrio harveyi]UIL59518.1 cadherin-like domain-containing protein [Vibrio harveyi]